MTLAEHVAALRRTLYRRLTRELSRQTSRPFLQLNALRAVLREGITTQAELADRLLVDAPAVSRLVARLEQDGLLRKGAGKDRRSVRLNVTARGRRELAFLERALSSLEADIRRHLTREEYATLGALMQRLHGQLGPEEAARK
jgi:DNA-binding MarR family transcriptional regulator